MKKQRLNILAFSFFPAIVPATSGGETRLYELYAALSRYHNIRLISSAWNDRPTATVRHGANFREIQVQKHPRIGEIYNELSALTDPSADISAPAVYLGGFTPCEMHQIYFQQYGGADVIIHDSPFTVSYDVMAGIDTLPRIYNSYNCETQLYSQMHSGAEARRILDIVSEAERRLLQVSDLVTCCSENDRDLLAKLADRTIRSAIVPNGGVLRGDRDFMSPSKLSAVFVGSQHYPNREAASFISDHIAPYLPDIEFNIVGNCLDEGKYTDNVRRLGFLSAEDKDKLLRSCHVALNPMAIGSGSSLKVTEYLSYGLPIISTRFGVRGLGLTPGQEYLEVERENFAVALTEIRKDPSVLETVGRNARAHFKNTLTWPTIAKNFSGQIEVVQASYSKSSKSYIVGLNDYDFTKTMSGGATRIRGLYERLRLQFEVVYIVITDDNIWEMERNAPGFTLIRIPKAPDHREEERRINAQFHLSAADVINLYMLKTNQFANSLLEILRKFCKCIITDHIYTSGLLKDGDTWIYSAQNHEASLKASVLDGHPSYKSLIQQVEIAENRALTHAAAIICVTEEDAARMTSGRTNSVPTVVIPNGVMPPNSTNELGDDTTLPIIEGRFCLFVASAHPPNVEACRFLLDEVAAKIPDVEFHIIGGVCENFTSALPRNVTLWGKLSEAAKNAIMNQAHLALNPVDSGGGSNVKIADYFSYGLPVISTPFGVRGFPDEVTGAVVVAQRSQFVEQIRANIVVPRDRKSFDVRRQLFEKYLNAVALSQPLCDLVSSLDKHRKKILFVTYRMTYPPRGGAEAHLLKLVEHLSRTGNYEIDIVSPDLDLIYDTDRFGAVYKSDGSSSGPYGLPHVHWAKFALDRVDPPNKEEGLIRLWEVQTTFDRLLHKNVSMGEKPTLLWGWSSPSQDGLETTRWSFSEAAVYTPRAGRLTIVGFAAGPTVVSSIFDSSTILTQQVLENEFTLSLTVNAGVFSFQVTAAVVSTKDPRPLGLFIRQVLFDEDPIDEIDVNQLSSRTPMEVIETLSEAAFETRRGCSLSAVRGPFSTSLELWLEQNTDKYDLLLTHNNIFLPPVQSIEIAARCNVPSILIPHAHLDDDYYHFPDMLQSVRLATAVLAAPSSAVDYLKRFNSAVYYHSPGLDVEDKCSASDMSAFRDLYSSSSPFCLVLGRKAGAKNYRWVIDAAREADITVILIGPDDDGENIQESHALYLGQQPRSVVRGALAACLFLVNMSSSESFGMVLLEAWLSKRPVIANRNCAAFNDIVEHGVNGLLTNRSELASAMTTLISDDALRNDLGCKGYERALDYDWKLIGDAFDEICRKTMVSR